MCINGGNDDETVKMKDRKVPRVMEFKYLGSTVQESGSCEREIKRKVQAGWNGWRKVSGVICDRRLPARVKGKVYSSVVRPAMVYGLETVAVTKKQVEEMEVAEMKMLKFAMGVTRKDKIRNEHIRVVTYVHQGYTILNLICKNVSIQAHCKLSKYLFFHDFIIWSLLFVFTVF